MVQLKSQEHLYQTNISAFFEDQNSFGRLFHQYYEPLNRFALTLVDSPETAEEVVSDVFIKMWKNRAAFSIKTSLRAYLFTAVRHQAIDYLRKAMRRRNSADEIQPDYPSDYQNPEDGTISEELEQMIETAIESLPPQGKKVFRLSRDQGMKYHEIAEHLNLSIKTVETHMGRSLRHLRAVLQDNL